MTFGFRKINFCRKFPRFIFVWLSFVCLLVGLIPIFGQEGRDHGAVVFCPLQRIWVEKNFTAPAKSAKLFGKVCAPDKLKESFFFELSKNLFATKISSSPDGAEKLFFAYAVKGKQAFAEINAPSNDSPEREFAKLTAHAKSTGAAFKKDFQPTIAAVFPLQQFPHPPTFQCLIVSDSRFAQELEKISRHINPRSPPVLV